MTTDVTTTIRGKLETVAIDVTEYQGSYCFDITDLTNHMFPLEIKFNGMTFRLTAYPITQEGDLVANVYRTEDGIRLTVYND